MKILATYTFKSSGNPVGRGIHLKLVSKLEASAPTLASSIASQLRTRITNGEIAPGEKLRLEELRVTFGVSLSPLREALSRLAAEGFVVVEDQRGYRVMPVSRQNLEEVTVLRCQMEGFALREAIRLGDDHWEGEIVAALYRLNKIEKMQVGDARIEQWEAAHRALHQKLLSACGMPLLLHFCTTLHDLSDRYRRLFFADHAVDRDVRQEHMDICHATVERRADDACRLLRSHVERTGANVLRTLIDRQAEAAPA